MAELARGREAAIDDLGNDRLFGVEESADLVRVRLGQAGPDRAAWDELALDQAGELQRSHRMTTAATE